jgi:hypothetical protein
MIERRNAGLPDGTTLAMSAMLGGIDPRIGRKIYILAIFAK